MAEWLTPRTLDQEVRVSSLARRVFPLDKELYSTLCLFTQVYKWVSATYCGGVGGGVNLTLRWTIIQSREGVAILLGMLHATETVISSGSLGLGSSMPLPFLFYYYYFIVKVGCITSVEGIKITVRLT